MKRWLTDQKGIKNLKLVETEKPSETDLKDREVLVQINCVSLNYRDTEVCNGTYGHHRTLDLNATVVPCSDMCGTVTASKSHRFKTGARVLSTFNQAHITGQITPKESATGTGLPLPGVLQEYRVFPDCALVSAPKYLSDEEAATLPIAFVTAWESINAFNTPGLPTWDEDTFVLLIGTGGVSIAGLQLANGINLKTIITSSSDEKLARAKELGADYTISYRKTPNWDEEVMRITGGKGANIIFETGGAETIEKSFNCIAFGGLIAAIGYLSGKQETTGTSANVNVLALRRNVTLKGILNGPRDRFEGLIDVFFSSEHCIKPVVDRVFEFEQAKDALEYLQAGSHFGKIVVKVS